MICQSCPLAEATAYQAEIESLRHTVKLLRQDQDRLSRIIAIYGAWANGTEAENNKPRKVLMKIGTLLEPRGEK